jgi:hypothetical protein
MVIVCCANVAVSKQLNHNTMHNRIRVIRVICIIRDIKIIRVIYLIRGINFTSHGLSKCIALFAF